ncbi:MAG TPA: hypothetical protein VHK69_20555 [Chitinophagaceae bacterium]|nr:hypothetical protein [Chitinophagaceae bacterium]
MLPFPCSSPPGYYLFPSGKTPGYTPFLIIFLPFKTDSDLRMLLIRKIGLFFQSL